MLKLLIYSSVFVCDSLLHGSKLLSESNTLFCLASLHVFILFDLLFSCLSKHVSTSLITEFPRLNLTYTSDTHCYIIFLRINRQAKTIAASCFLFTENDVRSFHSKGGDHFTAANTQASDIDIPVVNEYVQLSCNTEDRKFKLRFFL